MANCPLGNGLAYYLAVCLAPVPGAGAGCPADTVPQLWGWQQAHGEEPLVWFKIICAGKGYCFNTRGIITDSQ